MPVSRMTASSARNAASSVIVLGPRSVSSTSLEDGRQPILGQERQHRLAHGRAVGGQARADVQVQVDLPLSRPRGAAALDVDDVAAVEDGHVDRVAGLVAQLLQVRRRDLAHVHRVDGGEAEVEHARSQAVALALAVLLEVAEGGQRGDVAMSRAAREIEGAADLADTHQGLSGLEQRQHREAPLERLGHARICRPTSPRRLGLEIHVPDTRLLYRGMEHCWGKSPRMRVCTGWNAVVPLSRAGAGQPVLVMY